MPRHGTCVGFLSVYLKTLAIYGTTRRCDRGHASVDSAQPSCDSNAERTLLERLVLIVHEHTDGKSKAFMVTGLIRGKTSWHVVCREEIHGVVRWRVGSLTVTRFYT